ncbi:MAG: hypothetical protein QW703_00855 [Candidatus Aenigmatarchaeota archaeon]
MKNIVISALKKGILLSPRALKYENVKDLIEKAKEDGNFYIDVQDEPDIIFPKKRDCITVDDVVSFYNHLYAKLSKILAEKIEHVSINKIKGLCWIITIVREITDSGFVVEDPTGSIEVISKIKPQINDVIGIKGYERDGKFYANEIIWPDIPLNHNPKKIDCEIIFRNDNITIQGRDIKIKEMPAWISRHGVKILIYETNDPKQHLRKRHLISRIYDIDDCYIISDIPDIFYIPSKKNALDVYKGILIISGNVSINLADPLKTFKSLTDQSYQ